MSKFKGKTMLRIEKMRVGVNPDSYCTFKEEHAVNAQNQPSVTVNIFGTEYKLKGKSGTPSDYITEVARHVDDRMREIAQNSTTLDFPRIAVLAAVNMADRNLTLEQELEDLKDSIEQITIQREHVEQRLSAEVTALQAEQTTLLNKQQAVANEQKELQDELENERELRKRMADENQRLTSNLRSEEHTSELQSRGHLVCRLLLEKKT